MLVVVRAWPGARRGSSPNATVENPDSVGPTYRPGDPHGFEFEDAPGPPNNRMAAVVTSPWDGWPARVGDAVVGSRRRSLEELTDVAWAALDLNASVLSAMPVYRTRAGRVLPPTAWMANPDPDIYTDWSEFAKQLFWDFQAFGEAFVLPMARAADGWPYTLRVIPPPLVTAEMGGGRRRLQDRQPCDVTGRDPAHPVQVDDRHRARDRSAGGWSGPAWCRCGVLARYAAEIADGAIPKYILETEQLLTRDQAAGSARSVVGVADGGTWARRGNRRSCRVG